VFTLSELENKIEKGVRIVEEKKVRKEMGKREINKLRNTNLRCFKKSPY
jgi:hypothetical protein